MRISKKTLRSDILTLSLRQFPDRANNNNTTLN